MASSPAQKQRRRKPQPASSLSSATSATSTGDKQDRKVEHYEPVSVLPSWDVVLVAILAIIGSVGLYWYNSAQSVKTRRPFEPRHLPGRGVGLVATRDIAHGERILVESPLITVPPALNVPPEKYLSDVVSRLTHQQREAFYSLSHVNLPEDLPPDEHAGRLPLAIFQTNAVQAGAKVGLFPLFSRINHACSSAFNAVYAFREKEGELMVHTIRPIKRGEEVLTAYTDTKKPRSERQAYFAQQYAFNCTCAVCSLPDKESAESDARLSAMSASYQRFARWGEGGADGAAVIKEAHRIWDLGEKEGYWSERGRLAADATWVAAAHSDEQAARDWARVAVRWYGYELGRDSEEVQEMVGIVENPHVHQAWGSRAPLQVGGPVDSMY